MSASLWSEYVKSFQDVSDILSRAECLPATDGNFSARLNDRILITKSGVEKRKLSADSFAEASLTEDNPPGVSSEWPMHREIYMHRASVNCILHVHAPYLTTFAAAHRIPDTGLLTESCMTLDEIALIPFVVPGSHDAGSALIRQSPNAAIYLLANHGTIAVGSNIEEALHRLERAEFLARVQFQSAVLGGGIPLTMDQLNLIPQKALGELARE